MDSNSNYSMDPLEKLYLGFDFSTQQLKGVAVNERLEILYEANVIFDSDLPEFRTQGGVQRNPKDPRIVTANPLMWVKAVDMLLDRLKLTGLDFAQIIGISGSGQQHGSVYWKRGAEKILQSLKPEKFLHQQLEGCFSSRESPIWEDSSTTDECDIIEKSVGGPVALAQITGSRGYERFTGSQILKVKSKRPDVYENTERISLVSSFGTSIFLGSYAGIDMSDGSGMNLLNIKTHEWDDGLLETCGGSELSSKLGDPVESGSVVGNISKYFIDRYGFDESCQIVAFTGDNPASLIGMCLREGDTAISLGTSDTVFLWLKEANPKQNGHILCNPFSRDEFMAMLCYKNGSKTRERISRECAESDWELFSELLDSTPRGNFGNIGFYFDLQEIYPLLSGDYRFNKFNDSVNRFSKEVEVRACIEGQFLRMRSHAEELGYSVGTSSSSSVCASCPDASDQQNQHVNQPRRILATGGASANKSILQVLADVFNTPVYVKEKPNSAAIGAAFLAAAGILGRDVVSEKMIQTADYELAAIPAKDAHSVYTPIIERYKILEQEIQQIANNKTG